jgi:hypothetical protein
MADCRDRQARRAWLAPVDGSALILASAGSEHTPLRRIVLFDVGQTAESDNARLLASKAERKCVAIIAKKLKRKKASITSRFSESPRRLLNAFPIRRRTQAAF